MGWARRRVVSMGALAVGGALAALAACVGDDPAGTPQGPTTDSAAPDASDASASNDATGATDAAADTSVPSFDTDKKNCGRAGHDCLGGDCVAGKCKSIAIAISQAKPNALLVSGGRIFWVNNGSCAVGTLDGSVISANVDGSDQKALATNLSCPTVLAEVGSNLVIGVQGVTPAFADGKIIKVPKDGSVAPTVLYAAKAVNGITASGTDVFFGEASNVNAVSRGTLDGQDAGHIAEGQSDPRSLAVDVSTLFWTNVGLTGSLRRAPRATAVPLDGGMAGGTFVSAEVSPSDTLLVGTNLYVLIQGGGDGFGSLLRFDTATGARSVVASSLANFPRSLAMDGTHAYWTTKDIGLRRIALTGGTEEAVEAPGPNGIDVDPNAIYFSVTNNGEVRRLAK